MQVRSNTVEPNTGNVHQSRSAGEQDTASLYIQCCVALMLVLYSCLPAGCLSTEDYWDRWGLQPGGSAHTSQSGAGRPSQSHYRSVGTLGV